MADTFRCRSCGAPVSHGFVDLGETPLANSYVRPENLGKPEARFPLRAAVCVLLGKLAGARQALF